MYNLAECFTKYSSPLVVYSQSSHFKLVFYHEVFCFWIIWTKSLCRLSFINITITFYIQMMCLLPQSSVMLYFFARSSSENTLVTIELRNLMSRLFHHFRYICWFSLTTLIWIFAWMDILVRWLRNRVIKLCHIIHPMTLLSAYFKRRLNLKIR